MQFFLENLANLYVGAPLPRGLAPPPTGNPGSASDSIIHTLEDVSKIQLEAGLADETSWG